MEAFDGEKVIEQFEEMTKDAERVQRETLEKILEENGSAEYLQSLGLNGRTDPQSFKDCVPLVTHNDLEPYIQRIADGATSPILTGKPIKTISLRYFLQICAEEVLLLIPSIGDFVAVPFLRRFLFCWLYDVALVLLRGGPS